MKYMIEYFLPWPPPKGSDAQDFTDLVLSAIRRSQTIRNQLVSLMRKF